MRRLHVRTGANLSSRAALALCAAVALILAGASAARAAGDAKTVLDTPNERGVLRTVAVNGVELDFNHLFFQSLGTNGRSCASCHVPSAGWTITPAEVQDRFKKTLGTDPIFRLNDGSHEINHRLFLRV